MVVDVYQRLPGWVLGFHGTDAQTVDKILKDPRRHLDPSSNDYDWLGNGVYFWENDPKRALAFSKERMKWKKETGKMPAVIGAVIDLGLCFNLFDQPALLELQAAHALFAEDMRTLDKPLPVNEGGEDLLYRRLDRAVVEHVHRLRAENAQTPPYDTVRSGFHEGEEAYPGSGFRKKNHIQIAVRNMACIKGYFLPRTD